ncbi:MAG: hypothetical protein IJW40_12290 [Clostridia bacterium]|nr:hypothetical protein [Clostridia bacterium]
MIKNLLNALRRMWGELSTKRLIITAIYLVCALISVWYTQTHTGRAQRGIGFVAMIVFIILFVSSFKKLLSEEIQDLLDEIFERVGAIIFFPAAWCIRKIAKFLGIGRWAGWGEDERTFLWKDREKNAHRKKRLKNDQKWTEQLDNRQRVRFLYIEYMIKRIRSGYKLNRQMTPDEIAEDLVLEEEEKVIFSTYDQARYAKNPEISDNTVGLIMALTKRRQEIRKDRFD